MFKLRSRNRKERSDRPARQLTRRQRQLLLAAQLLVAAVVAAVVLLAIGQSMVKLARPVPDDVKGVLESTTMPSTYRYETQIVRRYRYDGDSLERHRVHSFSVDRERKTYQATVLGVAPDALLLASDSTRTIRYIQGQDDSYQEIEHVALDDVTPPTASDLLAMSPRLSDERETVATVRVQAWLIDFKPSGELIERLLLAEALDLDDFAATEQDVGDIRAGRIKVEWAHAWVTRDDRQLLQMDLKFRLGAGESGPQYRVLTTWSDFGHGDLNEFEIERAEG